MTNAELIRWAEEQTAITEKETRKFMIKQAVIAKLEDKGEATLKFDDGRVIYIDRFTAGGYRVSDFKVIKMVWNSDYQMNIPVRDIAVQKEFDTSEKVADYIAEIV